VENQILPILPQALVAGLPFAASLHRRQARDFCSLTALGHAIGFFIVTLNGEARPAVLAANE
jgi:uncharacterized membrane protein YdjX (TVP38/TMEM64 family)